MTELPYVKKIDLKHKLYLFKSKQKNWNEKYHTYLSKTKSVRALQDYDIFIVTEAYEWIYATMTSEQQKTLEDAMGCDLEWMNEWDHDRRQYVYTIVPINDSLVKYTKFNSREKKILAEMEEKRKTEAVIENFMKDSIESILKKHGCDLFAGQVSMPPQTVKSLIEKELNIIKEELEQLGFECTLRKSEIKSYGYSLYPITLDRINLD